VTVSIQKFQTIVLVSNRIEVSASVSANLVSSVPSTQQATKVTIRFEISNIRTALPVIQHQSTAGWAFNENNTKNKTVYIFNKTIVVKFTQLQTSGNQTAVLSQIRPPQHAVILLQYSAKYSSGIARNLQRGVRSFSPPLPFLPFPSPPFHSLPLLFPFPLFPLRSSLAPLYTARGSGERAL